MPRGAHLKGHGFDGKPENINRKGRPRRTVSVILEEIRKHGDSEIKPVDVTSLYLSLIDCSQEELLKYTNDKKNAMVVRIVAKALLDKKGFDVIETILDRSIGRPMQNLNMNVKVADPEDACHKLLEDE